MGFNCQTHGVLIGIDHCPECRAISEASAAGQVDGCELCGDFPVVLKARCHPSAALSIELNEDGTLTAYCYDPACRRVVAKFRIVQEPHDAV